jgi:hypothetical protein
MLFTSLEESISEDHPAYQQLQFFEKYIPNCNHSLQ